jgi:hypothetical protein
MYQFKWPLCNKKCSVGFYNDVTKGVVIENRICEGTDCLKTALSSGMTSLQVTVACKKCGLGEQ